MAQTYAAHMAIQQQKAGLISESPYAGEQILFTCYTDDQPSQFCH